jgi:hypothetical protein
MGGKSKAVTVGYKYFAGMHMVVCRGPVDKVREIIVDDRLARDGTMTGGRYSIQAPELFGSTEGGVSGEIDMLNGFPDQTQNDYLVSKLGEFTPSFRGVLSFVLRKMYLGNNPYLKKWSFNAQRIHVRQDGIEQWYDAKAEIPSNYIDSSVVRPSSLTWDQQPRVDWNGTASPLGTFTETVNPESTAPNMKENKSWSSYFGGASTNPSGFITTQRNLYCNFSGIVDFQATVTCGTSTVPDGEVSFEASKFTHIRSLSIEKIGTSPEGYGKFRISANLRVNMGDVLTITSTMRTVSAPGVVFGFNDSAELDYISFPFADGPKDMNPSHIIRECLTDPDWGMGYADSDIDDASFVAAADKLYAEKLGISIVWATQQSIEVFVKTICEHINAAIYVDRATGKFRLKLIRDDFIVGDLITLNPSNCSQISDFSRVSFGELVNSVTVSYQSHQTRDKATITVSDTALIAMQGSTISTSIDYPGFSNHSVASRVAQRDLKAVSTPLISCTIQTNSIAKDLSIGDCFKLTWPDYDLEDVVMRVVSIAYGDGKNNRIRITASQDVFYMPAEGKDFIGGTLPEGQPVSELPSKITDQIAFEVPYLEAVQQLGQSSVDSNLATAPDIGYFAMACARPTDSSLNARMHIDNGAGYQSVTTVDFCPSAKLTASVGRLDTVFAIDDIIDEDSAPVGSVFQIDDEICEIVSFGSGSVTVKRAQYDTVPAPHDANSRLYFWDLYAGSDMTQYVDGEIISGKLAARTSPGEYDVKLADELSVEMSSRMYRPYPPGNVKTNGTYFPASLEAGTDIEVTFTHRDRKQQTGSMGVDFSSGNVGPEVGTTYNYVITNQADELVKTGSTSGTSFELLASEEGSSSIEDPFWANVACLLNCNGTNAGTTFTDSGPNALTVTPTNVTTITSNKRYGSAAARMGAATGSKLVVSTPAGNATIFDIHNKDATIEFWAYHTGAVSSIKVLACNLNTSGYGNSWVIELNSYGNLQVVTFNSTGGNLTIVEDTQKFPIDQWVHVRVCFKWTGSALAVYVFINGVLRISNTNVANKPAGNRSEPLWIGRKQQTAERFTGVLDDIRFTSGVARSTSNFAVPNYELGQFIPGGSSNTKLKFKLESERDGLTSLQAHKWEVNRTGGSLGTEDPLWSNVIALYNFNGDDTSQKFDDSSAFYNHLTNLSYTKSLIALDASQSKFGGSSLKVSGDSFARASVADAGFSAHQAITIECWVRKSGAHTKLEQILTNHLEVDSYANRWVFEVSSTGYLSFIWWNASATIGPIVTSSIVLPVDTWHHVAVTVTAGGDIILFFDGVIVGSATAAANRPSSSANSRLCIGNDPQVTSRWFNGNIDDVRITAGVARYTEAFTPPTQQLSRYIDE